MKIPFFLVTGFLGSGKTTFLKKFINTYSGFKKIGIIQNEFAPASIDGTDLKSTGKDFEILEINNGSVFCVCLLGEFIKSLQNFICAYTPDVVILESSGLSDPIAIAELLQMNELKNNIYLSHTWCIIDATCFEKLDKIVIQIHRQIRVADTVIINKTDIAPLSVINDIHSRITELNPFTEILTASHCNVKLSEIFRPLQLTPIAIRKAIENKKIESCDRPDIDAKVIKITKTISHDVLNKFLEYYSKTTYRIKGFVNLDNNKTLAVQVAGGNIEVKHVKKIKGTTELIVMGQNLHLSQLKKDLQLDRP